MELELDSLGLTAFLTVCTTKNFTRAAALLHITQSALSQRIRRFEENLGTTLILRESSHFSLTSAGQEVLVYGRQKKVLLDELLFKLKKAHNKVSLRVGAFSSVLRSVIMPSLSDFLKEHHYIEIEYFSREIYELPDMLMRGKIDIAILTYELKDSNTQSVHLFDEKNVLIESSKYTSLDKYLDHDKEDQTTYNFLCAQGKAINSLQRSFYDDIYGVIDGVSLGLGRAVAPLHLIKNFPSVQIVKGSGIMLSPVYLHVLQSSNRAVLFQKIIDTLKENCAGRF